MVQPSAGIANQKFRLENFETRLDATGVVAFIPDPVQQHIESVSPEEIYRL